MEIRHPGFYLQEELKKRWRTQKYFASLVGKKISEVNELIKWKRNITIQRDIFLSAIFDDPEKKRINLQNDFDYITIKWNMDPKKMFEIISKKPKNKEHEIFEKF